ncbi:odorant receptor 4-like [Cardiocondyla obscurior]|uniref:odorant receptor 4-like n=1 Tax=Cardiocondyla obscurior TaxID=286306 RepID=UPI0039658421
MSCLLINRNNIILLTDILQEMPYVKPLVVTYRLNTLHYAILVLFSTLYIVVQSCFTIYWEKKLTFRAWLPYNYSTTILFHFTYFHQLIGLIAGALLHVACDSVICGLLLHVCCQLEILKSRLKRITFNPEILRDCIVQHNVIIKFAVMVNKKFRLTITLQFVVSTLVVCVTLYQLTKANAKIIQSGLYMSCMLTQIFLYCWYGNEVRLKSVGLITDLFEIEWLKLGSERQKDFLTITKCGGIPIEFTSGYIIPMNLNSFVALLKTSYSTYNILQQMRDTSIED